MPDQPRTGGGLWVAAAIGLFGYGGLAWLHADQGTLRDHVTPRTIVWFSVAFVGFLVALCWNRRHPLPLVWLWAIPIVFRLILLSTTPTLSDDVYRYLWDGHVAASGTNPYSHTLNAPALDSIEIPARSLANNPSLGRPYLPSAQGVFAVSVLVAPSEPITLQVVMTLFDLASAVLIVRLLALAGLPRNRVMLYLWNPLVILEIAHGAHLDAMMVFGEGASPEIVTFDDKLAAMQALRDGAVEGYSEDNVTLFSLSAGDPELVLLESGHNPVRFGIGVPEDDSAWRDEINLALQELWSSGEFHAIYNRWFVPTRYGRSLLSNPRTFG